MLEQKQHYHIYNTHQLVDWNRNHGEKSENAKYVVLAKRSTQHTQTKTNKKKSKSKQSFTLVSMQTTENRQSPSTISLKSNATLSLLFVLLEKSSFIVASSFFCFLLSLEILKSINNSIVFFLFNFYYYTAFYVCFFLFVFHFILINCNMYIGFFLFRFLL